MQYNVEGLWEQKLFLSYGEKKVDADSNPNLVAPKFFFFDLEVRNSLAVMIDTVPTPLSSYFGDLSEHFFVVECFRHNF